MAKSIKQKAIEHYDRMIEWAKKQPPRARVDFVIMGAEIDEDWYSDHCSYCKKYNELCGICPLGSPDYVTNDFSPCCGGLWIKMSTALTWRTWIKYAEQVREYIRENG